MMITMKIHHRQQDVLVDYNYVKKRDEFELNKETMPTIMIMLIMTIMTMTIHHKEDHPIQILLIVIIQHPIPMTMTTTMMMNNLHPMKIMTIITTLIMQQMTMPIIMLTILHQIYFKTLSKLHRMKMQPIIINRKWVV